jgi:hypothetical protein
MVVVINQIQGGSGWSVFIMHYYFDIENKLLLRDVMENKTPVI